MKTQEYLKQIERLNKMIQNKLSEISQLRDIANSVTAVPKEANVQASSDHDKIGSAVSKLIDLEKETECLMDEYISRRKRIIRQIDEIENVDYYHVLSMRYVGGRTFEAVADATNWSVRKVFSIHGNALQEFERLYGDEYLHD